MTAPAAPDDGAHHKVLALLDLRRYDDAVRAVHDALAKEPEQPLWWCLLAQAHLGLEQPDEAVAAAERAVALGPQLEWPHRLLSIAYVSKGRFTEAVEQARRSTALLPQSYMAHAQLAQALVHASPSRHEALSEADLACALAPNAPEAHVARGRVLVASGILDDARDAYLRALELDPQHVVARQALSSLTLRRANRFTGSRELADAAEGFASAVRTDPRATRARHSVDVVVATFLYRVTFLVFLNLLITYDLLHDGTSVGARALPAVSLVVPVGFAVQFVRHLSSPMRSYVRSAVRRRPPFLVAAVGDGLAVALIALSAILPAEVRRGALGVSSATTVLVLVWLVVSLRLRRGRRARGSMTTRSDAPASVTAAHGTSAARWRAEHDHARGDTVRVGYLQLLLATIILLLLAFSVPAVAYPTPWPVRGGVAGFDAVGIGLCVLLQRAIARRR